MRFLMGRTVAHFQPCSRSRPPDEPYDSVQAIYDAARRTSAPERHHQAVTPRTEAVASDALALRET